MTGFDSIEALRRACGTLPDPDDDAAAAAVVARQATADQAAGQPGDGWRPSSAWLAALAGAGEMPQACACRGGGVCRQPWRGGAVAFRAYPAAVTAQMVANFAAGGAAINQLAAGGGGGACGWCRSHSIARRRICAPAPAMDEAGLSGSDERRGMRPCGRGRRPAVPGRDGDRQHHRGGGPGGGAVGRRRGGLGRARHRGGRGGAGSASAAVRSTSALAAAPARG